MASNQDEGRRQAMLEKQRKDMMDDIARQKEALQQETERRSQTTAARFTSRTEGVDEQLKKSTIGLVTLEDFRKTRNEIEEAQRREAAQKQDEEATKSALKKKKKKEKKERPALSFNIDEEEEGEDAGSSSRKRSNGDSEEAPLKKAKLSKNPTIDTSFLPDRDREARERLEREQLRREWLDKQEKLKNEAIEITYSYWDGTGHRKTVDCKKGDNVGQFLEKCRAQFPELRGTSVDNMMYIKEDLIIPHHYTFYDFIVNKARGKSGPLFSFDVHDDVRMLHDATKERDESHAGKVVERSWYQRSKHIFPASRWEVYDPDKDYGAYKIGGS